MKTSDEAEFGTMLSTLGAVFGVAVEPAMTEAYYTALEDLDIAAVGAACKGATRTCEFFPRPVNLRNLVEGNKNLAAAEAWDAMVDIRQGTHGPLVKVKDHSTDEIANKAMKLLGPMDMLKDWEGPWAMNRFIELYGMLHDRQSAEDCMPAAIKEGCRLEIGDGRERGHDEHK